MLLLASLTMSLRNPSSHSGDSMRMLRSQARIYQYPFQYVDIMTDLSCCVVGGLPFLNDGAMVLMIQRMTIMANNAWPYVM